MYKFSVISFLLVLCSHFGMAQAISEEELMGKWLVKSVDIANDNPKHAKAVSFMKKAYTGVVFHFKGNGIFKMTYPKTANFRMKMFDASGENWKINEGNIEVGVGEHFSSMQIVPEINNGKIYFNLPMMRLQVEKTKREKAKKRKVGIRASGMTVQAQYDSEKPVERIFKDLTKDDIIPFDTLLENFTPAIALGCEEAKGHEAIKKCVSTQIMKHVQRKFDSELATELGVTGRNKISVHFIIDTTGRVINIEAEGDYPAMNESAINSVATLPTFTPAQMDGKSINMEYTLPIIFQVMH